MGLLKAQPAAASRRTRADLIPTVPAVPAEGTLAMPATAEKSQQRTRSGKRKGRGTRSPSGAFKKFEILNI